MMSPIVVPALEGEDFKKHLFKFDGIFLTDSEFGRLHFKVDVSGMLPCEIEEFLDELNGVHCDIHCFVENLCVEFDYFISFNLFSAIRGVVDKYALSSYYASKLCYWKYGTRANLLSCGDDIPF